MTAVNGTFGLEQDTGELAALPGLEAVSDQLAGLIAVLRAEQARRRAGIEISRPASKNLMFTGGPGSGTSRAARAVAGLYDDLGLLRYGQLIEIAAADLTGTTPRETRTLVKEVIMPAGDLLMITNAHTWHALPDRGQHVLEMRIPAADRGAETPAPRRAGHHPGRPGRPPSAPCYGQTLRWPPASRPSSTSPATARPARRDVHHAGGRGRVHPRPGRQSSGRCHPGPRQSRPGFRQRPARRPAAHPGHRHPGPPDHHRTQPPDPAALSTITEAGISGHLHPGDPAADDQRPGQYL
jgi:hypothetical protein